MAGLRHERAVHRVRWGAAAEAAGTHMFVLWRVCLSPVVMPRAHLSGGERRDYGGALMRLSRMV